MLNIREALKDSPQEPQFSSSYEFVSLFLSRTFHILSLYPSHHLDLSPFLTSGFILDGLSFHISIDPYISRVFTHK